MSEKQSQTTLVSCPGTFSYITAWKPRFDENKVDKETGEPIPIYSTMFLFPKTAKNFIKKFEAACKAAFLLGVKRGMFNAKSYPSLKKPLRDGDKELKVGKKEGDIYKGVLFFNATTTQTRPDIMKAVDGEVVPIEDESEFYSGCHGRLLLNVYPYNTKGNRGIAAGLNGFLKLKDGARLDGRPDAGSAFSKFADEGELTEETGDFM